MQPKQKYKKFNKNYYPLACVPKEKILKFHRTKWKKIQQLILKEKLTKKKQKITFKYFGKTFCHGNRWERVSHAFRTQLLVKKTIKTLFLNSVSNYFLKKTYLKGTVTISYLQFLFYRLEFRIDILLSRLKIFANPLLVKTSMQNNIVLVNKKKSKVCKVLSKGDIIFISSLKELFFSDRLKDSFFFHTFLEIDCYTNQIVIIKNWWELTEKDFFLLSRAFYNILDLRDQLFY